MIKEKTVKYNDVLKKEGKEPEKKQAPVVEKKKVPAIEKKLSVAPAKKNISVVATKKPS